MHRYGLVYLWHNKQLENQNRSVTKERREGQAPSPPRNKSRLQRRQQNALQKHLTSIHSDPSPKNAAKTDDTQVLESVEIRRARAEVEKAKLRVQKKFLDVALAEKRVSEMQVALKGLAGGDTQNKMTYNNLLQLARRESERRQKERLCALGELQSKDQLLARLIYRKCSM